MDMNMRSQSPKSAAVQEGKNAQSTSKAPASMSMDPKKKVPENKAAVKPPFAKTSMNSFMSNLLLIVFAICAIYIWRVTVWASEAGGYWALMTGGSAKASAASAAAAATSAAVASMGTSASSITKQAKATGKAVPAGKGKVVPGNADVQSQIYALAESLGIKPADLSSAIRPLIDPTVPNPAEEAKRIKQEMELKAELEKTKVETVAKEEEHKGPGIIEVLEEAFLD